MNIRSHLLILIVLISFAMMSLVVPDNRVEVPMKKIHKAINKVWKVEQFEVIDDDINNEKNCFEQGCWMKVKSSGEELGMVYIGRGNRCRSGGCSV